MNGSGARATLRSASDTYPSPSCQNYQFTPKEHVKSHSQQYKSLSLGTSLQQLYTMAPPREDATVILQEFFQYLFIIQGLPLMEYSTLQSRHVKATIIKDSELAMESTTSITKEKHVFITGLGFEINQIGWRNDTYRILYIPSGKFNPNRNEIHKYPFKHDGELNLSFLTNFAT